MKTIKINKESLKILRKLLKPTKRAQEKLTKLGFSTSSGDKAYGKDVYVKL